MNNKNDETVCPLCKQSNRCDVNSSYGCWCMNTQVPEALLAKVPQNQKGISCICNKCIARFQLENRLDYPVK